MFNMKNLNLLSESDKNNILNLYREKKIITEQEAPVQQNYTIQDLQTILNRAPYNAKLNPDNRFGPLTAGAISSALDMVKSGQASNYFQPMQTKQVTSIPTSTNQQTDTTQPATGTAATVTTATTTTSAQATQPLKTSQTSLIGPKTVKSEWCIQNTKREDEDCFSGKSMDYQVARAEANRAARTANHPYKRTETGKDQTPYYAIYATQTLDRYEEKSAQQSNQAVKTT
jgi:hypothetical protein